MIAVLVTLVSGFALLLFVFVRHGLRNAAQDAETATKLQQPARRLGPCLGPQGQPPQEPTTT